MSYKATSEHPGIIFHLVIQVNWHVRAPSLIIFETERKLRDSYHKHFDTDLSKDITPQNVTIHRLTASQKFISRYVDQYFRIKSH